MNNSTLSNFEIHVSTERTHLSQVRRAFTKSLEFENTDPGLVNFFVVCSNYLEFALMTRDGKSRSGRTLISRKMLEFAWHNRLPKHLIPIAVGPFPSPGYGWNLLGRVMVNPSDAIHLTGNGEGGWAGAAGTYYWVCLLYTSDAADE